MQKRMLAIYMMLCMVFGTIGQNPFASAGGSATARAVFMSESTEEKEQVKEEIPEEEKSDEKALETTITTSDGSTYEINVTYPDNCGIPADGTELLVSEIKPEEAGYDAYVDASIAELGAEDDTILFARVFDITIADAKDHSLIYEPGGNVRVSIRLTDKNMDECEKVDVLHITEQKRRGAKSVKAAPSGNSFSVDRMNASVEGDFIEFSTDGFSVYVVVAHEGGTEVLPRVMFHFISSLYEGDGPNYTAPGYEFVNKHGDRQITQILSDGEALEQIADPSNKAAEVLFYGWYTVNASEDTTTFVPQGGATDPHYTGTITYSWPAGPSRIRFERPIVITESRAAVGDTVHWTIGDASGSGIVDAEGNVHVYIAPVFENYHFVSFMQYARGAGGTSGNNLMTSKMFVLGSASAVDVKISDIRATSVDSVRLIFKGWEYNAGTVDNPEWIRLETVDFTGAEIDKSLSVSGDTELYPYFIEARWADFNVGPTGNGANYVASRFLLAWSDSTSGMDETEGQSVLSSLETPFRRGYSFGGWYVGVTDYNAETGEFTTGTRITETSAGGGMVDVLADLSASGNENGVKAWEVTDGKLKFCEGLSRLTLYAKWVPEPSLVSIVYWTENADDDSFFSRAVKTLSTTELNSQLGTAFASGSEITLEQLTEYKVNGLSVLDREYLDDVGAVSAGEQIFYDLKTAPVSGGDTFFEASKVISGEGTTIFNVYYTRKVFTLVFHIGRDGYISSSGEQTSPNNGSWLQMFYNDGIATGYDAAEGVVPSGSRGVSLTATATMTFNGVTYTNGYVTNTENVKNSYVPAPGEDVYTITAKYGSYIGDLWPTATNQAFSFTLTGQNKEIYTWSSYYDSRFTKLANDRKGSGQNWHPDINGVYSYMSAELCANRDGTAIINENQVHHFVAYYGDRNKAGIRKNYHILYEAIDGTFDSESVTLLSGEDYTAYNRTTWTTNVAQAAPALLNGRSFYEVSTYAAISNLNPESQTASDIEGYELIYSCYNTPNTNEHHIYFFYTPRKYAITFKYDNEADLKIDTYYYTESLSGADKYDPPQKEGYEFLGWYTNEAGSGEPFDFANSAMPAMNLVLYPVLRVLQYMVTIDPNGGVIDHVNYNVPADDYYRNIANDFGLTGTGHIISQATYFTADYNTPISPYTIPREYIALNDRELTEYSGDRYYYVNTQFRAESDGDWGLAPDLRNALYLTEDQLQAYYNYYAKVATDNLGYYTGVEVLNFNDFCATYTSYPDTPYRPVSAEHWTFMGWYQVFDDGSEASMPYNFNDPVTGPLTLRAKWRLDGGIYLRYNPYFFVKDGENITAVIGDITGWTDPADPTQQLYADQSRTHILRAPTNISATDAERWVFRGWRVVKPQGSSSAYTSGGHTYTYQEWLPIQLDDNNQPVYYDPGEEFTVESSLISQIDTIGSIVHIQAYYERVEDSYRRPDVTNLILDANAARGGYLNTTDSSALPSLSGPGHTFIDTTDGLDSSGRPTRILLGDLQSNMALHLYRYATAKSFGGVNGTNFFSHNDNYFLLGFDESADPFDLSTGKAYVPAYAPDAVTAVTRNENRTIYAMWEPMVYVTFVNTTGADIAVTLGGSATGTVSIVNEVTGEFDREKGTTTIIVPAKSGSENGRVKIVLPQAVPDSDSVTVTAVNRHINYKMSVAGAFRENDPYGDGTTDVRYGETSTYSGLLKTDATGIIVTYTEVEDPTVIFNVNGGTWTETESAYRHDAFNTDIYTLFADSAEALGRYEPAEPTRFAFDLVDKVFVGWTTNADIAGQTDFSSTTPVTWGDTTITPDAGSNVLAKVRGEYLWDFSAEPPYGRTLYAVWSDAVTVTFDLTRNGNNLHNWTGPATTDATGAYVFYRNGNSHTVTYTLCKGDKVPVPEDPTVDTTWTDAVTKEGGYIFLNWVTDIGKRNTNTNPDAIKALRFNFTEPVEQDATVYTSWMGSDYIRKYTFTVKNEIEHGSVGEEFEYAFELSSIMNSSGTYHISTPSSVPPVLRLKNNETYTVEITAVRYNSGWNHNSLYMVVTDRGGSEVYAGHLLQYVKNSTTTEVESSDYEVIMTVTQTPKSGYTTTVTADGTPSVVTTNDSEQTFVFRSAIGGYARAGNTGRTTTKPAENNELGPGYSDVAELIVFHNVSDQPVYPAPTGYHESRLPFLIVLLAGAVLLGGLGFYRKKRLEEEE
ncbi:MAG: InlB B-repeat-containing protein [Lachnospiraceae bacterium]|nr:InlB B-repeat-containing protein [Lachnospiraceae bacterium]